MFGGVLNQAQSSALPVGSIIIWYNTIGNIPEGWHVCDGTNGTPDLRGKFVLGADDNGKYPFDTQDDEEQHTLTVSEMPSHSHLFGLYSGNTEVDIELGSENSNSYYRSYRGNNTTYTGDSQPHNNMPPYYAIYYIMKIV